MSITPTELTGLAGAIYNLGKLDYDFELAEKLLREALEDLGVEVTESEDA